MENKADSPIFDSLRIAILFGMYEIVMNMIFKSHDYPKSVWKNMMWARAWEVEDNDWSFRSTFQKTLSSLNMTLGQARYL